MHQLENCLVSHHPTVHSQKGKMQTLKTALSLIREFCLKIDWCLGVYNHEASNRVFEGMIDLKM